MTPPRNRLAAGLALSLFVARPAEIAAGRVPAESDRAARCKPRALPTGQDISPEAADRLRAAPTTVRTGRPGEFRLRDGRVLVQPNAGAPGTLYRAADYARLSTYVAEELRARGVAAGESFHPLRGLIDDGERFGADAPARAASFATRLDAPKPAPKPDDASARLGTLCEARRRERCQLDAGFFRELVSFVGERARQRLSAERQKARWATRDDDGYAAPVIEWQPIFGGWKKTLSPWQIAARLLDEEGAGLDALLAEAVRRASYEVPPPPPRCPKPGDGGAPLVDAGTRCVEDGGAGDGGGLTTPGGLEPASGADETADGGPAPDAASP